MNDPRADGSISCVVKLRLRPSQERLLCRWLWHLTGVYNWVVRKIELDAADGLYWSAYDFDAFAAGHAVRLGIPNRTIRGTMKTAHTAWRRCFERKARKPRMEGPAQQAEQHPDRRIWHYWGLASGQGWEADDTRVRSGSLSQAADPRRPHTIGASRS